LKLNALDKEGKLMANPIFEEERTTIRMKELISRMRDDNDANISKIQDLNEDEIEKLREKLQEQYL